MSQTLRAWRRALEISQKTMAEKLGVHINTYQKWEQNPEEISIGNAYRISEIFEIPIDDIDFSIKTSGD